MVRKEDSVSSGMRTKMGFAFRRVYAGGYSVWLQLYEVHQIYSPVTNKWVNTDFTYQTLADWTKI